MRAAQRPAGWGLQHLTTARPASGTHLPLLDARPAVVRPPLGQHLSTKWGHKRAGRREPGTGAGGRVGGQRGGSSLSATRLNLLRSASQPAARTRNRRTPSCRHPRLPSHLFVRLLLAPLLRCRLVLKRVAATAAAHLAQRRGLHPCGRLCTGVGRQRWRASAGFGQAGGTCVRVAWCSQAQTPCHHTCRPSPASPASCPYPHSTLPCLDFLRPASHHNDLAAALQPGILWSGKHDRRRVARQQVLAGTRVQRTAPPPRASSPPPPPSFTCSVCSSLSCPLNSSFWFSGGTPAEVGGRNARVATQRG